MVSIITPVYNAEKYITDTIQSVLAQTESAWEYILVDDCSSDHSSEIIRHFAEQDARIRLIRNEQNLGAALSRNVGIDHAKGRWIAFLDSDDLWRKEKLERTMQYMKQQDAGFVFTGYEFATAEAVGTGKVVHVPNTLCYRQALQNTTIFTSTVLIDTQKVDSQYIHMPNVKSEDSATWWQILRNGHMAYGLDENLVLYRRAANTLSSNKLEAIRRIWYLYRKVEHLNLWSSIINFAGYAYRAVKRRV